MWMRFGCGVRCSPQHAPCFTDRVGVTFYGLRYTDHGHSEVVIAIDRCARAMIALLSSATTATLSSMSQAVLQSWWLFASPPPAPAVRASPRSPR